METTIIINEEKRTATVKTKNENLIEILKKKTNGKAVIGPDGYFIALIPADRIHIK